MNDTHLNIEHGDTLDREDQWPHFDNIFLGFSEADMELPLCQER